MRSFTVARVWGIPIRINVSLLLFLPILAWLIGSGQQITLYAGVVDALAPASLDPAALLGGGTPWLVGVAAAVGLFVSVTIHELGHSWVALRYGLEIDSITLWIFGGVASLRSVPREWDREFWIAVAGPVTSVLVGVACWLGLQVIPGSLPVALFVVGWLAVTNVVLAVFNMVPAFPMDGGRVLRALLARSRPYADATRIAARIGVGFALLFAVVGVLTFNPIMFLLALFVYGAATSESRATALDDLLEGLTVADLMLPDPHTVRTDATLSEFVDRLLRERRTAFPVADDAGDIVGYVTLDDLRSVRRTEHDSTRVEAVMEPAAVRVAPDADAFETLTKLGEASASYALVEEDGRVVGLLSGAEYAAALDIRRRIGVDREREPRPPAGGTV